MEASLLDMTRGLAMPVFAFTAFDPALEVEIEVVGTEEEDDDYDDVVIEYVFEPASIEEALVEPWFAGHDEALTIDEDLPFAPVATARSLHAVLGFATAVALAAVVYGATL